MFKNCKFDENSYYLSKTNLEVLVMVNSTNVDKAWSKCNATIFSILDQLVPSKVVSVQNPNHD